MFNNQMTTVDHGWRTVLAGILLLASGIATAAEKVTYYHLDALGSPVAATDFLGEVVWRETYQPYGERIQGSPAAADNARWYTGHVQDAATGLVYAGARYYDPVIGRFMAVDPVTFWVAERNVGESSVRFYDQSCAYTLGIDAAGTRVTFSDESLLHAFNGYTYAANNPYKYVDPLGLVNAIRGGTVTRAGWQFPNDHSSGLGFRVTVTTPEGSYDQYGHMDPNTTPEAGTPVNAGDYIGDYADPTNGSSTGPHVHHERRDRSGNIVDPGNESPIPGGQRTSTYGEIDNAHPAPHQGNDWIDPNR